MENLGLVSIVTPSYNCSDFIGKTIESIQAQTYENWELLITDDCSTDDSCEIIRSYAAKDPRIKLMQFESNLGPGDARNNSIRMANGRFIAFCDADDRWYPDKLETQLRFMLQKNCSLSYTSYDECDESGKITGYVECIRKTNYAHILHDNSIGCLTAIYDAGKIGKHYMPSLRKRQDWCLWIDIIAHYGDAYGLDSPLAIYRVRKGSVSANKIKMLKYNFEVYNKALNYNKFASALLLCGYFMPYYIYKKIKQKIDYKIRKK